MSQRADTIRSGLSVADWNRWSAVGRARVTAGWASALKRDPLLRRARVVVDLVIGRKRVLLSTVALTSTSIDGGKRAYRELLSSEPELVSSVEPGVSDPVARSVSVSFRGVALGVQEFLSTGWSMGGQGEVSLLVDGMRWEDRVVYVRGPLSGVRFGDDDELFDVTIADPQVQSAIVPPWTINTRRFPDVSDESVGEAIPVVVTNYPAAPCPRVRLSVAGPTTNLFLAGISVDVGSVWLDGVLTVPDAITDTVDDRGLPVTLIEFDFGTSGDSSSVYANLESSKNIERTLIDALRYILSSLGGVAPERVSERLFGESQTKLPDVGISEGARTSPRIVINSQARALEYLSELLVDWPMVSLAWDGAGIGPVVIDHRAEPVARLTLGQYPLLDRVAGGKYEVSSTSELRTSYQIKYGYNPMRDSWAGLVERNPDNSDLCRLAIELTEVEQPETMMEALSIGDAQTANLVIDWLCEHRSRPSVSVLVEAYPEAWLVLREGDTVSFTDARVGIADAPAIVLSRRWAKGNSEGGTRVELGLRIYPNLLTSSGGSAR